MNHWKIIKNLSVIYLIIVALALLSEILVSIFVEHGHKPSDFIGCYSYDAMLFGYKCVGFNGAKFIELFINLPLNMLYSIIFAFFSLKGIIMAVLMWALPILFVVSEIKLKNANSRGFPPPRE